MVFRMAGIAQDSIVDGPGVRLAVFFQGCPHKCPGCHNPRTHDPSGGRDADTEQIKELLAKNPLCAGVTLTGGEPFMQDEAAAEIARTAHALGKDVWAYTGFTYEELIQRSKAALECDVIVDGPFILDSRSLSLPFRGSANQRLIDVKASLRAGAAVEWKDPWDEWV